MSSNMARRLNQLANDLDARRTGRAIRAGLRLLRGPGYLERAMRNLERARAGGTTVQDGLRSLACAHEHLRVLTRQLEAELWAATEEDSPSPPDDAR